MVRRSARLQERRERLEMESKVVSAQKLTPDKSNHASQRSKKASSPRPIRSRPSSPVPSVVTHPRKKASTAWFGAHLSKTKGYYDMFRVASSIGATSFALFLSSPRMAKFIPPKESDIEEMKRGLEDYGFQPQQVLPHSGYLLNLAQPDDNKWHRSIDRMVDELSACNALGLCYVNVHPGSTVGESTHAEGIQRVADAVTTILNDKRTGNTIIVLEMTAGSSKGTQIGSTLEDMAGIIELVPSKLRDRVGICVDTCHCFAAGYDLASTSGVNDFLDQFDKIIGLSYLKGFHLNDSHGELGCHLDRHRLIGEGKIGIEGFRALAVHPAIQKRPLCLETAGSYETQIRALRRMEMGLSLTKKDLPYLKTI